MIEQVAKAILARVPLGYGMTEAEAREYATAALEALQEPTPEMLAMMVGYTDFYLEEAVGGGTPDGYAREMKTAWGVAIDVALGKPVIGTAAAKRRPHTHD
jgi:hypothetical protein